MSRVLRLVTTVTLSLLVAAMSGAAVEAASTPVGPNQHFIGLVNAKHVGAVIYVACPGPVDGDGDDTGPVVGDQTVAVRHVSSGGGDTGQGAKVIYARVTPTTIVSLNAYGDPQQIPASARVPCGGSGSVVFSSCPLPQPCGAGQQPDSVPVAYLNVAA
jgi:hypothetical protein